MTARKRTSRGRPPDLVDSVMTANAYIASSRRGLPAFSSSYLLQSDQNGVVVTSGVGIFVDPSGKIVRKILTIAVAIVMESVPVPPQGVQ